MGRCGERERSEVCVCVIPQALEADAAPDGAAGAAANFTTSIPPTLAAQLSAAREARPATLEPDR